MKIAPLLARAAVPVLLMALLAPNAFA